jgi:AmmeMemoRadiSam system protein A
MMREVLTLEEQRLLLAIARSAIVSRIGGTGPPAPQTADGTLASFAGAFVTLHHQGELRGCLGYTGADQRLVDVVARCAAASATDDPRFFPLTFAEIEAIDVEISVLGPLEPVATPAEIEIGRHGLIVELGVRRGLLLPQVATERNWDRETFFEQTCRKAGLGPDAWRTGATVFRFEAEVFGERLDR